MQSGKRGVISIILSLDGSLPTKPSGTHPFTRGVVKARASRNVALTAEQSTATLHFVEKITRGGSPWLGEGGKHRRGAGRLDLERKLHVAERCGKGPDPGGPV